MLEIKINESENAARIIVVGVGGAGNNAVNRMIDETLQGWSLLALTLINRPFSFVKPPLPCRLERS